MKIQVKRAWPWSALVGASLIALGLGVRQTPRAVADGGGGDQQPTYIGSAACKKCHLKQWKSWKETKMAHAFDLLKPGADADNKQKFSLDPNEDYSKEERCVKCHTTGYGKPGGYPQVDQIAGNDDNTKLASDREGIQCEDCHGPGSLYNAYMTQHEKDYDPAQGKALGLTLPDPDGKSCLACHHGGTPPDGSPTLAADVQFDAASKMKEEGAIHVHVKK